MPSPAFENLKKAVSTTISTAVSAGDKVYRSAVPLARKAAGTISDRISAPSSGAPGTGAGQHPGETGPEIASDTTTGPAPDAGPDAGPDTAADSGAGEAPAGEPAPTQPEAVSPAAVAKNIGHQRPVAKPAPERRATPEDSPGGKLPPPH